MAGPGFFIQKKAPFSASSILPLIELDPGFQIDLFNKIRSGLYLMAGFNG